ADLPRPTDKGRIDWWGTITLSAALLALNIALLNSGDVQSAGGFASLNGSQPAVSWPYYLASLVSFAIFLLVESRSAYPLIPLALFRRRNFGTAVVINFLIGSVLIIAMVNVPLIVNVLAIDVEEAALISGGLLGGMTLAMAIFSYVGGRLTERWNYRLVTLPGLALCALGFYLLGNWQATAVGDHTPYTQMAWQLVVLGVGFGLVIAPVGTAVINAAPDDQRGVASSLVIVMRLMGMSVGLSGLTAWGLRRFDVLRTQITLPDLPLTDPAYQQAIVDGLTHVTVAVLAETFLISVLLVALAWLIALALKPDE
ncbi:MAG: MFS transporter, partial [Chloroflexi bacterium]|nr:MFS transporter [Chloroflexota bacterium]